jgi:Tat protein translocase TatB subunit
MAAVVIVAGDVMSVRAGQANWPGNGAGQLARGGSVDSVPVFDISGEKLVVVLVVALIVLGPEKLPDAVRTVARLYSELRRMAGGFESELRAALDEPMREMNDAVAGSGPRDGHDVPDSSPPAEESRERDGDVAGESPAGAAEERAPSAGEHDGTGRVESSSVTSHPQPGSTYR